MSKHWNPARPTVKLGTSRIRRDPVPVQVTAERKVQRSSSGLEIWGGMIGVGLFAIAIAILTMAASMFTVQTGSSDAAPSNQFGRCGVGYADNCVVDGDTVRISGVTANIAGIEAPQLLSAGCENEARRGSDAIERLLQLLNSGKVSMSGPMHDAYGRDVRKIEVNGRDVGEAMIASEMAREYLGEHKGWC